MTNSEIKQSVEVINKLRQGQMNIHRDSTELRTLLDLASRYLSITGLPAKDSYAKGLAEEMGSLMMGTTSEQMKAGFEDYKTLKKIEQERNIGFNSALDACRFALIKRCEGIENIVAQYMVHTSDDIKGLSQSIKNYLLEEGK